MKLLKLTDITGQVLMLVGSITWISLSGNQDGKFILIYFFVGGWQVLSFLVHLFLEKSWLHKKDRTSYGKTLLWIFIIGLGCWLLVYSDVPLLLWFLFGMLIVSPVLAVWYFIISVTEWQSIQRRKLVHLK